MGNRTSRRKTLPDNGIEDKTHIGGEESTHVNKGATCCPSEVTSNTPQISPPDDITEYSKKVFYKFVILHSEMDEMEALRIKNLLQDTFHIKPGLVFAEMPAGQLILQALDDAVNGSAWTIILLTGNLLREAWCEFQSHATLINSIHMSHKHNTVIPIRPKDNYLPRDKTPFPINLINALEEGSSEFTQLVERTFQESVYQKQYAIWKAEKESSGQREL
ncbi:TIR domain-containing adapter molecule 2 [Hyperolius riggenbachi]|uniref:TIR domain-containing adapter molecule 2 n=1 Tax=Hyperolius riggenbachi TaxID=752182 RepID=UPI0035A3B277